MNKKFKDGEEEAKIILEKMNIEFDEKYCDDGLENNMPDFRLKNGDFLEITHTNHNLELHNIDNKEYKDIFCINKFDIQQDKKRLKHLIDSYNPFHDSFNIIQVIEKKLQNIKIKELNFLFLRRATN